MSESLASGCSGSKRKEAKMETQKGSECGEVTKLKFQFGSGESSDDGKCRAQEDTNSDNNNNNSSNESEQKHESEMNFHGMAKSDINESPVRAAQANEISDKLNSDTIIELASSSSSEANEATSNEMTQVEQDDKCKSNGGSQSEHIRSNSNGHTQKVFPLADFEPSQADPVEADLKPKSNLQDSSISAAGRNQSQNLICHRRKLTFLQRLILRKWPCLALSVCIMTSLVFAILLSVVSLLMMQNLSADCSAMIRSVSGPIGSRHLEENPFDLASMQLHAEHATRLYAAADTSAGSSPSSRFRRLSGVVVPSHYDLFIQPRIAEPFNMTGWVKIRIECKQPTDNITLHSRDLNIDEKTLKLEPISKPGTESKIRGVEYDKELDYLIVKLKDQLEANQSYILHIQFDGFLADDLAGFYRIRYTQTNSSEPTWVAATQFQATDARKAFPCFDEPLFKATFSIQIKHWNNMSAISNMPAIKQETDGIWITDTFDKTHRMSTYLVAFAVTNFASRSKANLTVWSRPEFIESANYALEFAVRVLKFYEQFFGVEYPLPKMDMIALPDFNAGAMENWGLITYRETAMLYDEKKASVVSKRHVAAVVAHELAHQWFGNLVTPKWWDDLWLNEGFASFVEFLGVDHVHPNWRMNDQFVISQLHDCFAMDSLPSTHQISFPVGSPDEIGSIFDTISYDKGASLIRMMSHFLTLPGMTKGLKNYLKALKYGNAEQSDLWHYLSDAQPNDGPLVDVAKVMNSWTLQVGYPVVTLRRQYDGSRTSTLEQTKFDLIKPKNDNQTSNLKWEIPISMTYKSDQKRDTRAQMWLHQDDPPLVQVPKNLMLASDDEWFLVNVDEVGYFRVNYDERNWQLIIDQLNSDHTVFSPTNRAQIVNDLFGLARVGLIDYEITMKATDYLSKENDYIVWNAASEMLSFIDEMLFSTPNYGDWRSYLFKLQQPHSNMFQDTQWKTNINGLPRNRDDYIAAVDFKSSVARQCHLEDENCLNKVKYEFTEWRRTGNNVIDPSLRATVYCTAIEHGNRSDWEFLWKQFQGEQYALEREKIITGLSCSREPWLLHRLLSWTFLSDKGIRRQDGSSVIGTIFRNPYGRDAALNFLMENWSTIRDSYGRSSFSFANMIKSISTYRNTQSELNQVLSLYEIVKHDLGTAKRAYQQMIEAIEEQVGWRRRYLKFFDNWLDKQHSG